MFFVSKIFYSKDSEPIFSNNKVCLKNKEEHLLLKVIFSNQKHGFISLQTWEKLGDLNLRTHLHFLQKGYLTDFIQNALRLASYYKSPLWEDLFCPNEILNHYMIADLLEFFKRIKSSRSISVHGGEALFKFFDFLEKNQFKKLKIKIKNNRLDQQTEALKKLVFQRPLFSSWIRLDFNNALNFQSAKSWLYQNNWILKHLDFIEDPFYFKKNQWGVLSRKFLIPLAFDRAYNDYACIQRKLSRTKNFEKCFKDYSLKKFFRNSFSYTEDFDVLVIKPTVQNVDQIFKHWKALSLKKKKSLYFVFTHNRDHWLGKLYSLLEAKRFRALLGSRFKEQFLDSGLLSEDFYKKRKEETLGDPIEQGFEGSVKQRAYVSLNADYKKKVEERLESLVWKPLQFSKIKKF